MIFHINIVSYCGVVRQGDTHISILRKGNCLDNNFMWKFFGRLKVEMFCGGEILASTDEFIIRYKE